ncbi:hypothetical protein AB6A40_003894 [Gnathostoma spinigerum]|uniref:Uncharacterized protein n=1 Tax=Gnathostoma spinigerum TaxID=75299 RepID=A0ABD6EC16_9BILA
MVAKWRFDLKSSASKAACGVFVFLTGDSERSNDSAVFLRLREPALRKYQIRFRRGNVASCFRGLQIRGGD